MTDYIEPLYENRDEEEEYTRAYIDNMYHFYGYGLWVVCLKDNGKIIGRAGISNREVDGENKLEIGYIIGKPYWHQGYAFEACKAVCKFAREEIMVNDMVAFIDGENTASINLAKKLGFKLVEIIESSEKVFEYYRKIL